MCEFAGRRQAAVSRFASGVVIQALPGKVLLKNLIQLGTIQIDYSVTALQAFPIWIG
jgi:hypothetical protein